jgi:hypothetical protein
MNYTRAVWVEQVEVSRESGELAFGKRRDTLKFLFFDERFVPVLQTPRQGLFRLPLAPEMDQFARLAVTLDRGTTSRGVQDVGLTVDPHDAYDVFKLDRCDRR